MCELRHQDGVTVLVRGAGLCVLLHAAVEALKILSFLQWVCVLC